MRHKWWKKFIAWHLYQKRDLKNAAIIHSTTALEVEWNRKLGFKNLQIEVPLGTFIQKESAAELRNTSNALKVLFVGRVYQVKGLMNVVRAATKIKDVNIKFTEGNCYGLIGANGAGKSTFLRILSGEIEPTNGDIIITPGQRLSFLKQDHFKYDQFVVLDTVIMGNQRLYDIMKEKDAIYAKEDFTEEDGIRASELEGEFATMNGWEAESDAATGV